MKSKLEIHKTQNALTRSSRFSKETRGLLGGESEKAEKKPRELRGPEQKKVVRPV